MKTYFVLMFLAFLVISGTACNKVKLQRYCVHPLINGGQPFPLKPTSYMGSDGLVKDKGIAITGAQCLEVEEKAE